MNQDSFRPQDWSSADAAGLPILSGLVRHDESLPVSQGGQEAIDHAIQPPMGTRFRLKASVDISKLSPESQVVAQAMKTYGLILADNGSNFFFSRSSASVLGNGTTLTWNDNDIRARAPV